MFWGRLGAFGGGLGGFWERLGGVLGRFGNVLGRFGAVYARLFRDFLAEGLGLAGEQVFVGGDDFRFCELGEIGGEDDGAGAFEEALGEDPLAFEDVVLRVDVVALLIVIVPDFVIALGGEEFGNGVVFLDEDGGGVGVVGDAELGIAAEEGVVEVGAGGVFFVVDAAALACEGVALGGEVAGEAVGAGDAVFAGEGEFFGEAVESGALGGGGAGEERGVLGVDFEEVGGVVAVAGVAEVAEELVGGGERNVDGVIVEERVGEGVGEGGEAFFVVVGFVDGFAGAGGRRGAAKK